jgi:hypothetical protein
MRVWAKQRLRQNVKDCDSASTAQIMVANDMSLGTVMNVILN